MFRKRVPPKGCPQSVCQKGVSPKKVLKKGSTKGFAKRGSPKTSGRRDLFEYKIVRNLCGNLLSPRGVLKHYWKRANRTGGV